MSRLVSTVGVNAGIGGGAVISQSGLDARKPRSEGVCLGFRVGALGGIRTPNLLIRSQMLYPLSYGRSPLVRSA